MVERSLVEGWIKKADEDFQYAKVSLEEGLEFYSQICLHFHQAVEKYLKAYIVAKKLDFQKIHDLTKLLQICTDEDTDFNRLIDLAIELNPYYIEARYPNFVSVADKSQAFKALKAAEEIGSFVKSKLSFLME